MRLMGSVVLSAVVLLGMVLGGSDRFAAASGREGAALPVIGSWLVMSDPGDAEYSPRLMTLSADGTAMFVSGENVTAVGAWQVTGDASANVAFTVVTNGPAYIVIRAAIDIDPDGQSLSGTFTLEAVFDPAGGGTSGEIGPGTIEGTRLVAEGPGTPVASFEEFFPPADGTPGATPEALSPSSDR